MFNTQRSFFRPSYEDFQPHIETKATPESHLVLIHLRDFAPQHVSAKFESLNRKVKVSGERPLGGNRWKRFSVEFTVPESCEATKLLRKFEAGILTIIMPKKVIEEGKATSSEAEAQKGKEVISQEPKSKIGDGQKGTSDSVTQKGEEEVPKKMDKKIQTDENLTGPLSENGEKQGVEKKETEEHTEKTSETEKVQVVIPPKPTTTRVEEGREVKARKGQEGTNEKLVGPLSENGKNRGAEKKETEEVVGKAAEKAQELILAKPTTRVEERGKTTITEGKAPKDQGEKNEKLAGPVSENHKTTGAQQKETEEVIGKTSQVGEPRDDISAQKERKEYAKKEKMNEGGKGLKDVVNYSKGKGIKEEAASGSGSGSAFEALTRMEEDKKMIMYLAAAAVAVTVTVGLYSALRSLAGS